MASISRVCNKQQGTFGNKNISVYGKLQKGVKNGSKYKEKRKSRKNNKVCEENEEGARRSRSSVEEGIGGYEETSG